MSDHRPVQRDLDRLYRRFIIERAGGVCERCHRAPAVDPCHVFTSRIEGTRWDPDNAWAGCRACHDWTHSHVAFTKTWNQRRLGPDRYRALQLRHNERQQIDYDAIRRTIELALAQPKYRLTDFDLYDHASVVKFLGEETG